MYRILINDHEHEVCNCLKSLFETHDYKVQIICAPEKVMAMINEFQPDILLMNYDYLPVSEMNGLALLNRVREQFSNHQLPVIVASCHCQLETINQFMRLGIHDFVSKPVTPDYMLKIVQKCLN